MQSWIDGALYPDRETPSSISTLSEQVDFLARSCVAWDTGVLPEVETVNAVLGSGPTVDHLIGDLTIEPDRAR